MKYELEYIKEVKAIPSDNPDDYLVVEDRKKKTTWHLQVKEDGTPNHRLMGSAWAALTDPNGFRGNKYEGPNKQQAITKLRALYKKEKMTPPGEKSLNDETKRGARNSNKDRQRLQTIHDYAVMNGANCNGIPPKSYQKSVSDAPNLRDHESQSCDNCRFFKWLPSPEISGWDSEGDRVNVMQEPQGICTKFDFIANGDWTCDAWETIPPEPVQVIATVGQTPKSVDLEELDINDTLVAYGGEVKALGDGKIAGYLVRFTSEEDPDLEEDFFTKDKTEYGDHKSSPVFYHHGMDATIGKRIVGHGELKIDDVGVWIESQLQLRDEYEKAIYELAKMGKLGWSSGVPGHLVERERVGKATMIKMWLLGNDASLTPTPAEYRNKAVVEAKSLEGKALFKELLADITGEDEVEQTQAMSGDGIKTVSGNNTQVKEIQMADKNKKKTEEEEEVDNKIPETDTEAQSTSVKTEVPQLSDEQVDVIAEKLFSKLDTIIESKATPAIIKSENLGDPNPYKALTRWAMGEVGVKGLNAFTPKDTKNATLRVSEKAITFEWKSTRALKAALQEDTAGEGGNLVPNDFFPRIIAKRDEAAIARKAGAMVISTNRDYVDIPYEDGSQGDFSVVAEEGASDESEPTFGNAQAHVYNMRRLVKVSEELLEDDGTNLGEFLTDGTGRAIALAENNYTLVGTGTNQPQGVFVGGSVGYTFADTNSITAAEIASLFWTLGEPYHEEATWVMRGATMGTLQALTGNPFSFTATPVADTMRGNFYGNKPYYLSDKVAAIATGAKTIMLGNWRFYGLVERRSLTFSRNPWLYQENGQVGLFWSIRWGGVVLQSEAFKWGIQA